MNSALQCLVNTEPLTKYFLFEVYLLHINKRNTYGTKGELAKSFGRLIDELFVTGNRSFSPWELKMVISRKAPQFSGFSQHDSQEVLSFLLEILHEDINEVSKKPYVEYKDSNGRSDEEISTEYWNGLHQRERSILIDLFYGQLKSRVRCTQCDHESLTFDPFNMLSIPIPTKKSNTFSIKYIPYDTGKAPVEFLMNVGNSVMFDEVRAKIEKYIIRTEFKDQKTPDDWLEPFIT